MDTTTNQVDFILDILEDQKRKKKRRIELISEQFEENLNEQAIIDELINMPGFESFNNKPTSETNKLIQQSSSSSSKLTQNEQPQNNLKPPKPSTSIDTIISKRKGKKPNIKRDHLGAHQKLIDHFFRFDHHQETKQQQPQEEQEQDTRFYSQFKLSKNLFRRIHTDLTKNDLHFTQRKDALGNLGHSSYQKVLVAIRQLNHGIGKAEAILDDYIRMAESTALECLIRFCYNIQELYGPDYLRQPNENELDRISQYNTTRGFPEGLHAYLGFRSWEWENCPTGWSGRFKSSNLPSYSSSSTLESSRKTIPKKKLPPTIVLEALVDYRGWFWAGYISTPGSCKDLDLFHPLPPIYSPGFNPPILSNGQPTYYLTHQIYPLHPPLISPLSTTCRNHLDPPSKLNALLQNDFDRAVDLLQDRFKIIYLPCRLWSSNSMIILIKTAFILHNMIIDDQRQRSSSPPPILPPPPPAPSIPTTDIQVYPPSSSSTIPAAPSTTPSQQPQIPPHVFAKLNHRYQLFNSNSSLIPQE